VQINSFNYLTASTYRPKKITLVTAF